MPQLDTIHIFITFLWTWLTLYLIVEKTKTFKIISKRGKMCMTTTTPTTMLPWT